MLSTIAVAACAIAAPAPAQVWRDEADARIAQHRMADLTVHVVDANGQAVSGASVAVNMQRHAFGFGTAVPASLVNGTSADAAIFRDKLRQNFNQVVFENDLKWPAWTGMWGPGFNWSNTQRALDWLDANDLPARGHYLSWATWSGSDAYANSDNVFTLEQRLFDHIDDVGGTVGGRVFEWDVINHPVGWLNDTYENRMEAAGLYADGLDFYKEIIQHARSAVPSGTPLWINEDNILAGGGAANEYERIIRALAGKGAAPDGIGFQGHFIEEWGRIRTPEQVYAMMNRFANIVPRLRVTELDIDVGTDDARQAQLLRDYLTVMFSHPSMEAVTLWGFWENAHWRPDAALYNADWTEKAALQAYQDLVFDAWWTEEAGLSDVFGEFGLRGFLGDYQILVEHDGRLVAVDYTLGAGSNELVVVMPEPAAGLVALTVGSAALGLRPRRRHARHRGAIDGAWRRDFSQKSISPLR